MNAHESRLYFYLQRTAAQLKTVADRAVLEVANVTAAQAAVLALVDSKGPLRQNTLAEALEQQEAAVTQMVAKLESRGLISRHRCQEDQRAWQVETTREGKRTLARAARAFERVNAQLDAALVGGQNAGTMCEQLLSIRRQLE